MDYQTDQYRLHVIKYHLVLATRLQEPLLIGDIAKSLAALILNECKAQGWKLHRLIIQPTFAHVSLQTLPTTPASDVVRILKQKTSFSMRQKYPSELMHLPCLWRRTYLASTLYIEEETIQDFCERSLFFCCAPRKLKYKEAIQ